MSLIGSEPALILYFDDLTEALVLRELTVDAKQILLVLLEDLNEAIHSSDGLPPPTLLHDSKTAAENVANVSATTNI